MRWRLVLGCWLAALPAAHALDKQGSAHGGETDGADTGFDVSGALTYGVSLYNPTYGARPDNTARCFVTPRMPTSISSGGGCRSPST